MRCVFAWSGWEGQPFEERTTLWRPGSPGEAIELAGREAQQYVEENGAEFPPLSQAYAPGTGIDSGTEVLSLLRDSDLPAQAYSDTFFATGKEHGHGESQPIPEGECQTPISCDLRSVPTGPPAARRTFSSGSGRGRKVPHRGYLETWCRIGVRPASIQVSAD